jgi:nucleoid-associated protein YgaU
VPGLTVTLPGTPARPKARLIGEAGTVYVFRHAPQDTGMTMAGVDWREAQRPGQAPLLTAQGRTLRVISTEWLVGQVDPEQSVDLELFPLARLYESGQRVRYDYGQTETGWWRITALRFTTEQRNVWNQPSRVSVSMELTEASDANVIVHPIQASSSGEVAPVPTAAPAADTPATPGAGGRTHTVAAGETLGVISARELGTTTRWREIADLNEIVNPNRVAVGQVLRIP